MLHIFMTVVMFLVVWGIAYLMNKSGNYTLFEGFVIITLSMLLAAKVKDIIQGDNR